MGCEAFGGFAGPLYLRTRVSSVGHFFEAVNYGVEGMLADQHLPGCVKSLLAGITSSSLDRIINTSFHMKSGVAFLRQFSLVSPLGRMVVLLISRVLVFFGIQTLVVTAMS